MLTETEYIIECFEKAFGKMQSKRMALYGLGRNTEDIIKSFPGHNIEVLLDGSKTDGCLFGKNIVSLDRAIEIGVECIVIVARANSTRIIFKRIEDKCKAHNLEVYDIHGVNLLKDIDTIIRDNQYFDLDISSVKEKIFNSDAISFDIFDTLLTRKVLYPTDVFEIVEKQCKVAGFSEKRISTERELNKVGVSTFEVIYEKLVCDGFLTRSQAKEIKEMELNTEIRVIIPRKEVCELLKYAKSLGKTISLISDMYLSKENIEYLLEMNGIDGYDNILISCEYGATKTSGLYAQYKKLVKGNRYLHIGDDIEGDIEFARLNGIDSIHILSPIAMAEISSYKHMLSISHSLFEHLLSGMVIANVFNSPFVLFKSNGKPTIDGGHDFGYVIMGALFTGFIYWMIEQVIGKFDVVLFSSRDGYLVKKIYETVLIDQRNVPKPIYFYTSRMAAFAASIKDEEDLVYAASIPYSGTFEQLLKKRFFLVEEDIFEPMDGENVIDYCLRHKDSIYKKSAELRQNYLKYIGGLDFNKKDRIAFFDLVSSGSCQLGTQSITEKEIDGFYFINIKETYRKKAELRTKSYIESGLLLELQSFISKNYEPLEEITAPNQPTLVGFKNDGEPIFGERDRNDLENIYVEEVQTGVIDYCKEFSQIICGINEKIMVDSNFVDKIYELIRNEYNVISNCQLSNIVFKDDFTSREFKLKDMFV